MNKWTTFTIYSSITTYDWWTMKIFNLLNYSILSLIWLIILSFIPTIMSFTKFFFLMPPLNNAFFSVLSLVIFLSSILQGFFLRTFIVMLRKEIIKPLYSISSIDCVFFSYIFIRLSQPLSYWNERVKEWTRISMQHENWDNIQCYYNSTAAVKKIWTNDWKIKQ